MHHKIGQEEEEAGGQHASDEGGLPRKKEVAGSKDEERQMRCASFESFGRWKDESLRYNTLILYCTYMYEIYYA